jgi:hypothetical protein
VFIEAGRGVKKEPAEEKEMLQMEISSFLLEIGLQH